MVNLILHTRGFLIHNLTYKASYNNNMLNTLGDENIKFQDHNFNQKTQPIFNQILNQSYDSFDHQKHNNQNGIQQISNQILTEDCFVDNQNNQDYNKHENSRISFTKNTFTTNQILNQLNYLKTNNEDNKRHIDQIEHTISFVLVFLIKIIVQ